MPLIYANSLPSALGRPILSLLSRPSNRIYCLKPDCIALSGTPSIPSDINSPTILGVRAVKKYSTSPVGPGSRSMSSVILELVILSITLRLKEVIIQEPSYRIMPLQELSDHSHVESLVQVTSSSI